VDKALPPGPVLFRELRRSPPDVILIDLGRLPSQGRDVALSIRGAAATRRVPIVFIEGPFFPMRLSRPGRKCAAR
jgi:DNA-binding response OmpR family regulator